MLSFSERDPLSDADAGLNGRVPLVAPAAGDVLVSTYKGYTAERFAQGVSDATTNTVVIASVWTLVLDYFFTALWST